IDRPLQPVPRGSKASAAKRKAALPDSSDDLFAEVPFRRMFGPPRPPAPPAQSEVPQPAPPAPTAPPAPALPLVLHADGPVGQRLAQGRENAKAAGNREAFKLAKQLLDNLEQLRVTFSNVAGRDAYAKAPPAQILAEALVCALPAP